MTRRSRWLFPVFRSDLQSKILAQTMLNPGRQFSTADLARRSNADYATTYREVQGLLDGRVLVAERVGQAKLVSANTHASTYRPLVDLMLATHGPEVLLPAILDRVPDITSAYIYGSWAARQTGERGGEPGDIDVLVVGDPSRQRLFEASEEAEHELGREVNMRAVSKSTWESAEDPFLVTIRARPLIELSLERDR